MNEKTYNSTYHSNVFRGEGDPIPINKTRMNPSYLSYGVDDGSKDQGPMTNEFKKQRSTFASPVREVGKKTDGDKNARIMTEQTMANKALRNVNES